MNVGEGNLTELLASIDAEFARTAYLTGLAAPDAEVHRAMAAVPRERFVPPALRHRAFDNSALAIGFGQTISQPFIVALMTTLLRPRPHHRVLEVGAGSGYQAAILAQLVHEVFTVEIVPELCAAARTALYDTGCDNVIVRWGDGAAGWPEQAPFDGILVAAAGPRVPPALVEQLAPGGRLVSPMGPHGHQRLLMIEKAQDGSTAERNVLPVVFVPLTGVSAAPESGGGPR